MRILISTFHGWECLLQFFILWEKRAWVSGNSASIFAGINESLSLSILISEDSRSTFYAKEV